MAQQVQRWIEVTPSQFTHEAEGLERRPRTAAGPAPVPRMVQLRVPRRPGQVARGRPARPRPPPPAPGRAEVLRGHPARRRPDLAPRRPPRRRLATQARPPQGAAPGEQAPGRAAALGAGDAHHDPGPEDVVPFVQESVFLHHPGFGASCRRRPVWTCSPSTAPRTRPACPASPIASWRPRPRTSRSARTRATSSPRSWRGSASCSAASARRARG